MKILLDEQLEQTFTHCRLGLSARRIREHTKFLQINPFAAITAASAAHPEQYVDVVDVCGTAPVITGCTLANLSAEGFSTQLPRSAVRRLLRHAGSEAVKQWLALLGRHLARFGEQRATGSGFEPFLGEGGDSPLGVQGLHCALATWLEAHLAEKASGQQWLERIRNLSGKGLRVEELNLCTLEEHLAGRNDVMVTGTAVRALTNYRALQLSIIPLVAETSRTLNFFPAPADAACTRIKPKLQGRKATQPDSHEPVLGYWLDFVEWEDLLGYQKGWVALTRNGKPIVSPEHPTGLCASHRQAVMLAARHARKYSSRYTPRGQWSRYRLRGGECYREWLVTLPNHASSFYSSHFPVRNVLLHVRCDIWEGADGQDVLVLQEVQSDWAQQARRAGSEPDPGLEEIPTPPWLQEWPALALKLMLLHAAHSGVGALAWTPGSVQVERYQSLGEAGLLGLYDRTLPAAATRILRPYGKQCEPIDVYQPVTSRIAPADTGYDVLDEAGQLVGKATTWKEARQLLPGDAEETLVAMHGVNLDVELQRELVKDGFFGWGGGIH